MRLAQPWSLRYPLVQGQGNFGSPGNDRRGRQRYTECRMAPLAMEMVRDIDEETVDFAPELRRPHPGADGPAGAGSRTCWSTAAPASRSGMATNIPPHNLREVAAGVQWALAHPEASREELLAALLERVKGPDFPTGALIVGRHGIEHAYRTGRGSITMRAVVEVEEDTRAAPCWWSPSCRTRSTRTTCCCASPSWSSSGKISGISDVRDDSSSRTGMRLIIELKRDAVAKVVLNNLYKHTQLQDTFGANMLALVDGVPRTLTLDAVRPPLDRAPDRGHPAGARATGCARPRSARTSCAAASRRSTRSTRSSR